MQTGMILSSLCIRALALALVALSISACATSRMHALMPTVTTMDRARQCFGDPNKSEQLVNGNFRHEWMKGQAQQVPGQYITEMIFVGTDSDGFPEYHEREVFIPWHLEGTFCHLVIQADRQGKIVASCWEGTECDAVALSETP